MDFGDESFEDEKPLVLKKRKLNAGPQSSQTVAEKQSQQPNDNLEVSDATVISPESRTTQYPTLWFSDGLLVVVASDGVKFRLHPGILARHSEVFKERIDGFSPPGTALQHGVASLPRGCTHQEIILHLPDKGDDLSELFTLIYDGTTQSVYHNHDTRIPFYYFYQVLRLAVKYKMQAIMESGFARLEQLFAPDYNTWMTCEKTYKFDECSIKMQAEDTLALILLAREAGRTNLLPVLLYIFTSEADWESLLEGVFYTSGTVKLSIADQITCVKGHTRLQEIGRGIEDILLREAFGGRPPCFTHHTCIAVCKHLTFEGRKKETFDYRMPFHWAEQWIDDVEQTPEKQRLCATCKEQLKSEIDAYLREEWEKLGETFGIADWTKDQISEVAVG